jgi:hypothetical protein
MQIAIQDLSLEHLWVVYPEKRRYSLDSKITVIPLEEVAEFSQTGGSGR